MAATLPALWGEPDPATAGPPDNVDSATWTKYQAHVQKYGNAHTIWKSEWFFKLAINVLCLQLGHHNMSSIKCYMTAFSMFLTVVACKYCYPAKQLSIVYPGSESALKSEFGACESTHSICCWLILTYITYIQIIHCINLVCVHHPGFSPKII